MSDYASPAKIASAQAKLGGPIATEDSLKLSQLVVALGNVTSGGGGGGTGTVTSVAQSFTGGLISVSGSPITTAGTLALTVAGTSGGIPYFSSASTWATSAALAANALVVGGGAGLPPGTVTTGVGILSALGINIGSAGAPVLFNGAGGTPSSITLTNGTSLPVSTGISGLGTSVATALAVNVGTAGAFIVNGGALGTPSSGTLTNCTGLPVAGITGTLPASKGGTGVANGNSCTLTLPNAATTISTGGTLALGGFTLTVPATGTAALLGTANVFTALQTITQGATNTGILASTGYSLTGASTVGMVSLAGTLITSGAPSVFKMALSINAASAATKYLDISGGATGTTPIFSLHAGTFGGTALGGQGIAFGDPNADTACTITSGRPGSSIYFGCTQQFGLDILFSGPAMRFRSGYLFQISSTTDSFGTADIGYSRNAAGVLEINSGTAGTFRDIKTRNTITNPVTVASLAGATKGARSFVTDASTTILLGLGTVVVGGGANNVPVYYDGTNWLIG